MWTSFRRTILFFIIVLSFSAVQAADDGTQIDVLLAYTPGGQAQMGGTGSLVLSKFSGALNQINTRFTSAGIDTQLRLVGARQTFYQEQINIDFHADLTNLIGTADGFMDELHAVRDVYAADLVILVAGNQFAIYKGDAPAWTGADATQGLAIVEGRYFTADTLMAEVGHLMGVTGADPTLESAAVNANRATVAAYRESLIPAPTLELLINGGFDMDSDADGWPDFWTPVNPRSSEGTRCNSFARTGGCALKLDGISGGATRFRFRVGALGALPGDSLTLTGYARTKNAQAGATLRVIVRYVDAPEQKLILNAPLGTTAYSALTGALMLTGAPKNVLVVARFDKTGAAGKTWFDDVSLTLARLGTRE